MAASSPAGALNGLLARLEAHVQDAVECQNDDRLSRSSRGECAALAEELRSLLVELQSEALRASARPCSSQVHKHSL